MKAGNRGLPTHVTEIDLRLSEKPANILIFHSLQSTDHRLSHSIMGHLVTLATWYELRTLLKTYIR